MAAFDYLVVGAGWYGAVVAERLASELNASVRVIDRRPHIGGNSYSEVDSATSIEFHRYGTHIFHTSNADVWNYVNRFSEFNGYVHQVLASYQGTLYQLPINLETINQFFDKKFRPTEARAFLQSQIAQEAVDSPENLEEKAISSMGRPLYEAFVRDYTVKQWGKSPTQLPTSILTRLPLRFDYDESYFNHCRWQGVPCNGYTALFSNLLKHPRIKVELNCDFFKNQEALQPKYCTVYTGPIDRYFNYVHGRLEWRSIRLEKHIRQTPDFQGTSVINFPELAVPYTRCHEPRHLHKERAYAEDKTIIFYEYSQTNDEEPYYPVRTEQNLSLYQKYRALAEREDGVLFGGRLGSYAYMDMDVTILAALQMARKIISRKLSKPIERGNEVRA